MPEPMTEARLAEMEAVTNSATPGPWEWEGARMTGDGYYYVPQCSYLTGGYIMLENDAEGRDRDCLFIAAAREYVPALIAEVRRLREARQWIPISDLPEFNTPVIALVQNVYDKPNNTRRIRAMYVAEHTIECQCDDMDCGCEPDAKGTFWLPAGWREDAQFAEQYFYIEGTVTHWQPLPEPSVAEAEFAKLPEPDRSAPGAAQGEME